MTASGTLQCRPQCDHPRPLLCWLCMLLELTWIGVKARLDERPEIGPPPAPPPYALTRLAVFADSFCFCVRTWSRSRPVPSLPSWPRPTICRHKMKLTHRACRIPGMHGGVRHRALPLAADEQTRDIKISMSSSRTAQEKICWASGPSVNTQTTEMGFGKTAPCCRPSPSPRAD